MSKRVQCNSCAHRVFLINLEEETSDEKCLKKSPLFSSNSNENCDFFYYKPQSVYLFCGFCKMNTEQLVVGKQTILEKSSQRKRGEVYQVLKCSECEALNFGERLE